MRLFRYLICIIVGLILLLFLLPAIKAMKDIRDYGVKFRNIEKEIQTIKDKLEKLPNSSLSQETLLSKIYEKEKRLIAEKGDINQVCVITTNLLSKATLIVTFLGILFAVINIVLLFLLERREDRFRREIERIEEEIEEREQEFQNLRQEIENQIDAKRRESIEGILRMSRDYISNWQEVSRLSFKLISFTLQRPVPAISPEVWERVLYLFSENKAMCRDAIWYLAEYGNRDVIPYLEWLRDTTSDEELKREAINAISEISRREGLVEDD